VTVSVIVVVGDPVDRGADTCRCCSSLPGCASVPGVARVRLRRDVRRDRAILQRLVVVRGGVAGVRGDLRDVMAQRPGAVDDQRQTVSLMPDRGFGSDCDDLLRFGVGRGPARGASDAEDAPGVERCFASGLVRESAVAVGALRFGVRPDRGAGTSSCGRSVAHGPAQVPTPPASRRGVGSFRPLDERQLTDLVAAAGVWDILLHAPGGTASASDQGIRQLPRPRPHRPPPGLPAIQSARVRRPGLRPRTGPRRQTRADFFEVS